jgi:hypothetical protein
MFISVTYFIRHLILKLTDPDINYNQFMVASSLLSITCLWGLLVWKFPIHAPKIMIIYILDECIFANISFRDLLP